MTPLWTAAELRAATGVPSRFAATGVSIDTRTLQPGDLFVALVGENGDGHDHAAAALAKGAAGVMLHRYPANWPHGAPALPVKDTLAGLRALALFARARFAGRMVAVTGSVGKTTTKEMLRAILSAAGPTHAAVASYNNHWGVPLTLARLPADAAYCVCEIGMNHAGEIAPLAELVHPGVALITSVERVHIGHLGSIEAIAAEKASIRSGLPSDGIAILPGDSPYLPILLAEPGGTPRLFGAAEGLHARLIAAEASAEANEVTAQVDGTVVHFRLAAPGRHMAMNAVAAIAAAHALGIDPLAAAAALAGFAPLGGRGARREIAVQGGTALLLDESYNASPASVRAALSVLALQPATRRIAVLGDMLELGEDGPREHSGLLESVAQSAGLLFTCGTLMRALFESAPPALRGGHADDSAALAPIVAAALRPGDAVLIKGSLGSRMKRVVSALETQTEPR